MITGTEPNPSAPGSPKADLPAGAQIAGDMVMGDKNVTMTAGGDIVLGNKITNIFVHPLLIDYLAGLDA
jgi:hypothetical protein